MKEINHPNKEAFVATLEEGGEKSKQEPGARELIRAKIREIQDQKFSLEDGDLLKNEGMRHALGDICFALAPPTDDEKKDPRFDSNLNLISAHQGLQEIEKIYGSNVIELGSIKATLIEEMQKGGMEGIEQFMDLDIELEDAKAKMKEAIRKGSENMLSEEAAKAAENVEAYLEMKRQITENQHVITGGVKNFYSTFAQRVADRIGPTFAAFGEKIDEQLAKANPSNAIFQAVRNFGESRGAATFARRAALTVGALGAAAFLLRPSSGEAASHQSENHIGEQLAHDEGPKFESVQHHDESASSEVSISQREADTPQEKISRAQGIITQAQEQIRAIEEESIKHPIDDAKTREAVEKTGMLRHIIEIQEAEITHMEHAADPAIESLRRDVNKRHEETNFFEGRKGLMTNEQREKLRAGSEYSLKELYSKEAKLAVEESAHGGFHLEVEKHATIQDFQEQSMWVQRATMEGKNLSTHEKDALTQKFIALQEAIIKGATDGIKEVEQKLSAAPTPTIAEKFVYEMGKYEEARKLAKQALELTKQASPRTPKSR